MTRQNIKVATFHPRAFALSLAVLIVVVMASAVEAQQMAIAKSLVKSSAASVVPADQARILDNYGKLPLSFEANHGQADARVKFLSRAGGYTLFLTANEAVLTLRGRNADVDKTKITGARHTLQPGSVGPESVGVLRMKLRNANPAAKATGEDELAGTSNYFIGRDPTKWQTNVPTYAKVKYEGIYSGIDMVYYGNQQQLEYDFIVAPGADPHRIAFDIRGAKQIRRNERGDLVLKMHDGELRWQKPVVYQEKNGTRQEIAARYSVTDKNRIAFEVAQYDESRPLYIDPLIYSTYLGGSGGFGDSGKAIAVDSLGYAYVTGFTGSTNFPTTPGALQTSCGAPVYCENIFVTKFNPAGSALVYSTYLSPGNNYGGAGIAVDKEGDAYIVGGSSAGFPTTPGAFQTTCGSTGCVFVTEIDPSGSALIYSTFLGGGGYIGDIGYAIAVDSTGSAYVTGQTYSTSFPVTPGAFQTSGGGYSGYAFVTKFNPSGSALVYSSYLGAGGDDRGDAIAVDSAGNAYVTGATCATDFPVTPGAFQTTYPGGSCGDDPSSLWGYAYVTKFDPTGSALVYSTYLGGSGITHGLGIAADSGGNAYVTGYTLTTDFPTTSGAFQTLCSGPQCGLYGDAFVTKFNPTGTALVYSTYLGGFKADQGNAIAVDSDGNAYITGATSSPNFPVVNPIQKKEVGTGNAFVSKVNPTGSALVYSTYLGGDNSYDASLPGDVGNGIAVDKAGNAFVVGYTLSSDFPTTPGAFQPTCGDPCARVFVSEIASLAPTTSMLLLGTNPSIYGQAVTLEAMVTTLGSVSPTGTITFSWSGNSIGTATLNSSGVATLTKSNLNADSFPLTATYSGDANNASSTSAVVNQVVNQATSSAALTSSPNPSTQGEPVRFNVAITSPTVIPNGPVTFTAGTTVLGTAQLSGGRANFTISSLPLGTTTVKATYYGDSDIAGSSASVTQIMQQ